MKISTSNALVLCGCLLALACSTPRNIALDSPEADAGQADGSASATNVDGLSGGGSDGAGGSRTGAGSGGASGSGGQLGSGTTTPVRPGEAQVVAAATEIDFGQIELGVATDPRPLLIRNDGSGSSGPVAIDNSVPALVVSSGTCGNPLDPGKTCTIMVAVRPDVPGVINTSFAVTANPGGRTTITVKADARVRLTVKTTGTGSVSSTKGDISCGSSCTTLLAGGDVVTLQAHTTNGSGFFFSGWSGAGCSGPGRECTVTLAAATTVTATFTAMTRNLIFVTSGKFPQTLGSVAAYDAKCNDVATAAGINGVAGNSYIAFISDATSSAPARLGTARGWVRMDGKPFADTQAALFTQNQVFNSIRFDENGVQPAAPVLSNTGAFYDYAATKKVMYGSVAGFTCGNWTGGGSGDMAGAGNSEGGAVDWAIEQWILCDETSLTCMGRAQAAPVGPEVRTGKLIWVSAAPFIVGGGQTPDALCMAERPAGVAQTVALIATTRSTAASLVDRNATYVRPDGTIVATGAELATDEQPLQSGAWQTAAGAYVESSLVWSGSPAPSMPGNVVQTCGNWTDAKQNGGLVGSSSSGKDWFGRGGVDCGIKVGRVMCLER